MHPDIAYDLNNMRRAELVAEASHQRLVREAKQARAPHDGPRRNSRWWWVLLPSGATQAR